MLLDKKECLKLLKKYKMPENIIQHTLMVNKIAVFLAEKLYDKGIKIFVPTVDSASMLHDIGKIKEVEKEVDSHITEGYEILQKENLIEEAIILRKHGGLAPSNPITRAKTWEEKVVYYADQRVMHDKICTIKERIEDVKKRYPKYSKEEEKAFNFTEKVEKEIFNIIGIKPEDLSKYIK